MSACVSRWVCTQVTELRRARKRARAAEAVSKPAAFAQRKIQRSLKKRVKKKERHKQMPLFGRPDQRGVKRKAPEADGDGDAGTGAGAAQRPDRRSFDDYTTTEFIGSAKRQKLTR